MPEGLQPPRGRLRLAAGPLHRRADAEGHGREPQGVLPCRCAGGGGAIARRLHEAASARLDEIRSAYRNGHGLHRRLGFLRDRDREIWKPLFSLCQALAPSRMPELERSAADIAALKTVPTRPFEALAEEEKESEEMEYAEKLLEDTVVAMGENEKMATGELARRLRELPTSPWRTYRGSGITDDASGAMTMARAS